MPKIEIKSIHKTIFFYNNFVDDFNFQIRFLNLLCVHVYVCRYAFELASDD